MKHSKEIIINSSLRDKIASELPDIELKFIDKEIQLKYDRDEKHKFNKWYIHTTLLKIFALEYFNNLIEFFAEIRYATITVKCYISQIKEYDLTEEENNDYKWICKFYIESAVYRYYSFWEIVGRFFNAFFNLKLEVGKKYPEKENSYFFGRQVIEKIVVKFSHPLLYQLLEIWGDSNNILEYRSEKTHISNPNLEGMPTIEIIKKYIEEKTEAELKFKKGYSIDYLEKLLNDIYYNSKKSLELLSILLDIGHQEIQIIQKDELEHSNIIIPDFKFIEEFNRLVRENNLRVQKNKKQV